VAQYAGVALAQQGADRPGSGGEGVVDHCRFLSPRGMRLDTKRVVPGFARSSVISAFD